MDPQINKRHSSSRVEQKRKREKGKHPILQDRGPALSEAKVI